MGTCGAVRMCRKMTCQVCSTRRGIWRHAGDAIQGGERATQHGESRTALACRCVSTSRASAGPCWTRGCQNVPKGECLRARSSTSASTQGALRASDARSSRQSRQGTPRTESRWVLCQADHHSGSGRLASLYGLPITISRTRGTARSRRPHKARGRSAPLAHTPAPRARRRAAVAQ